MSWSLPANRYDEIRSAVADLIEDWGNHGIPIQHLEPAAQNGNLDRSVFRPSRKNQNESR